MARCPNCLTEISSDVSSCPKCGHSFDDATRRLDSRARQTTSTSFDSIDDALFVPSAMSYSSCNSRSRSSLTSISKGETLVRT